MKPTLGRLLGLTFVLLFAVTVGAFSQGRFRNIASCGFDYYDNGRYSLDYEDVLISPIAEGFYLVTAIQGTNTDLSDLIGGRLGLSFDLPGAYYGEVSYKLKYGLNAEGFEHVGFISATYESGPALASVDLTGEFSADSLGGILSPALSYSLLPALTVSGKIFLAYQLYDQTDGFFNFAFLGKGKYTLVPGIALSLGGTYSTVYEPDIRYGKWSVLGELGIEPSDFFSVTAQAEYTDAKANQTNPHEILSARLVVDIKFPRKK